jgi:hypothetical protein
MHIPIIGLITIWTTNTHVHTKSTLNENRLLNKTHVCILLVNYKLECLLATIEALLQKD